MQLSIKPILEQISLTANEIRVYESLLKRKTVVASTLARELGLDKSSTYRALESMVDKGLVIVVRKKRGTTYQIGSLQILKDKLHSKMLDLKSTESKIDEVIEKIKTQALQGERDTYIRVEKGFEAHKALMELSLQTREKVIREKFPMPGPDFSDEAYRIYVKDFIKRRVEKGILAKSLYNFYKDDFDPELMRTSSKIMKELRILPGEIDNSNYVKIWDDYTEIISFSEDVTDYIIIVIRDSYVAELMKTMFDYMWARSPAYYDQHILETRTIGDTPVSVMGVGTWGVGGYATKNPYNDDLSDIDQIRNALGKGVNYIDVSHMYGAGYSLPLVAKAIANFPRRSLFINAKIGYMVKKRGDVRAMCERYLSELQLEYVDRLMIHGPRSIQIPIEEVVGEIDDLIDRGKVRHLAVSNLNVEQLKRVVKVARHPVSGHEIHFNLMIRANEENGVVKYCTEHKIMLVAYQPLRRGFLVGLEDPLLHELAEKYQKTQAQIMLNWLSSKKNMMFLVKATKGSHVNENTASLGWKMSKKDYGRLDLWRMPGYTTPEYDTTGNASEGIKIDKL